MRAADEFRSRLRSSGTARATLAALRKRRAERVRLTDFAPRSSLTLPEHEVKKAAVPAIDAHNHLGRWLSHGGDWMSPDVRQLIDMMDSCNLRAIVNLDGRWGDELEANLDRYDRAHPGRFATFCHVDWAEFTRTGNAGRLIAQLEASARAGARGLKVWKDLGFTVRDPADELIVPDDPRLDDLWDAAGALGLPVLIHTGDPRAYSLPVDRHNERLEELLRWPTLRRSTPGTHSFDRLLDSFEAVVRSHPGTTFVGAHCANAVEDLGRVDRLLAETSNLVIDISARASELGRQPRAARELVLRHPDKVLFGTDVFPFRPDEVAIYFRLLETADEYFPYSTADVPLQGRWNIYGLDLPTQVLSAVYRDNALRVIPGLTA